MKRQDGFMIWVYLAVVVFVAAAGAGIVWKYNNALEGKIKAENEAKTWLQAHEAAEVKASRLQGDINERDKLLGARDERIKTLIQSNTRFAAALAKLAQEKPEVAVNLATPVHPDVRRLRRVEAGCSTADLSVQCTPQPARTNPAASAQGRHVERPPAGEQGSANSP
jgi:hypothetical protein